MLHAKVCVSAEWGPNATHREFVLELWLFDAVAVGFATLVVVCVVLRLCHWREITSETRKQK